MSVVDMKVSTEDGGFSFDERSRRVGLEALDL